MAKTKRVELHEAPKSMRTSVFRRINAVLREHGVSGTVSELHLTSAPRAGTPAGDCPAGTIRKVVCFQQPDGTTVCEERCVPL